MFRLFSFFRKDKDLTPAEPIPGFYQELAVALISGKYAIDESQTTLIFSDYSISIVVTPCVKVKDKLNITIVPHPNNGISNLKPDLLEEFDAFLLLFIQCRLKSLLNPIEVV